MDIPVWLARFFEEGQPWGDQSHPCVLHMVAILKQQQQQQQRRAARRQQQQEEEEVVGDGGGGSGGGGGGVPRADARFGRYGE